MSSVLNHRGWPRHVLLHVGRILSQCCKLDVEDQSYQLFHLHSHQNILLFLADLQMGYFCTGFYMYV